MDEAAIWKHVSIDTPTSFPKSQGLAYHSGFKGPILILIMIVSS